MQVKTYIYGTPFGFNFYEDDSQYKDYFKSFYISSRTGRRLMVNRLDNGETTYNYLCYGITECKSRPNAFFGMSFVMSDYLYCANFSKLYEWFDFLFEKLINEHHLITQTENGLQYQVEKFYDNPTDTEWLKANIPNILSAPDIRLERYDSNFSNRRTGIIAQFNTSEQPDKVIQSFRKNRWISLSPTFKSDKDFPELDWMELSALLDVVTKQLLPIAINPEAEHLPILKSINSEMKDNYKSISEYIEKVSDNELKDKFIELRAKYYEVLNTQLPQIAQKINSSNIQQDGFESEPSHGKPPTPPVRYRTCQKCGRHLPIEAFENNDSICIECHNKESKGGFTLPKNIIYAGVFGVVFVVLVVCIIVFKPFGKSDNSGGREEPKLRTGTTAPITSGVDKAEFMRLIEAQNFEGAFDAIAGKDTAGLYKATLKEAYETYLLQLTPVKIQEEMITRYKLCEFVGVDKDTWNDYAKDVPLINKYLSKSTLGDSDRAKCKQLIDKYTEGIYNTKASAWLTALNKIPKQGVNSGRTVKDIKIIVYQDNGSKLQEYNLTSKKIIAVKEFVKGGYVDIYCAQIDKPKCIQGNNPADPKWQIEGDRYRIKPEAAGTWVYQLKDGSQITIIVKRKKYLLMMNVL